jgi:outer membrane receptor protein involved in Fe transport
MRSQLAIALVVSASAFPLAQPASAETAEAAEEIVVTAQKREELLRNVPQSVTAISEDTLERAQANDFSDYVGRVPGMAAISSQPGNSRLILRGVDVGGVAATIGTYVDETPFGSSTALANGAVLAPDLDPFDIQRVEVLRGPQGTLYGASALGGLIKFVTADPSSAAFEARLRATGETTEDGAESWGARGLVNVPLGDQAALRVSGYHRSQGGFIDDAARGAEDVNAVETSGARATFLLRASDDLTIRLSAASQDIESDATSSVDYFPVPLEPVGGELNQTRSFSEEADTTYRVFNGTADWDLGWASLVSSSSYNELDQHRLLDTTAAYGAIFGGPSFINQMLTQDRFTQETRLASPDSDRIEWLVGLYYDKERAHLFQDVLAGTPPGANVGLNVGLDSEYSETAAFGSITYYFVPQFDISVGARHSWNDQTAVQFGTAAPSGTQSSDDAVTTYSVAPRWRVSDETMIYARVASGYRPGGPNILSAFGTIPSTFDADEATNYEIGVKSDLIDGLLRFDAALFRIDWDKIQLLISDGVVAGNGNGGTAISQGVEWSATLTPIDGLSVLWSGAYTDAHLTSDTDPTPPVLTGGEDGDSLPNSPEWSSSLDIDYEWSLFGDASAYIGGSWRYVGERMSDFSTALLAAFGDAQIEFPSYDVFDLRAGIDFDRFALELFAKNVADERAVTDFGAFGQVPPNAPGNPNGGAAVLRPRTIGATLTAEF